MGRKRRRNKNFFAKLEIGTTAFGTLGHKAKWDFNSVGLALLVESDDRGDVVQYSFDGENVHGDLTPFLPSEGIVFDNRFENTVWFRRATPGNPVVVRIEAWQHDA